MNVSISSSHGTKPVYLTRGYRGYGWIMGFNSRFGGWCIWVSREMPSREELLS